jgi:valyl-tRNA synthetase
VAREIAFFQDAVVTIRNLRSEMNVPPSKTVAVAIRADAEDGRVLKQMEQPLQGLARVGDLAVAADCQKPPHAASGVAGSAEVFVLLEGVIDLAAERARLSKDLKKVEAAQESSRRKLANEDFLERAKPEVVEREREKLEQREATRAKIEHALSALED